MLWDAGQERVGREARERLAAIFTGVRDGYLFAQVASGRSTWSGPAPRPSYLADAREAPSAAAQAMTLARLARQFPGAVVRGPGADGRPEGAA